METNNVANGRGRRTVDELIIAEMFLVQATIESATAIGDGLSALGRQLAAGDDSGTAPADTLSETLQRIAGEAVEPYTSRLKCLREMISANN